MGQLAEGIAAHQGAKPLVNAFDESGPSGDTAILLQAVVPLAGGVLQVECRRPDLLVLRRALRAKELLALVKLAQGILDAVVLGEAKLVDGLWRQPMLAIAG